jgi:hypothetical protein
MEDNQIISDTKKDIDKLLKKSEDIDKLLKKSEDIDKLLKKSEELQRKLKKGEWNHPGIKNLRIAEPHAVFRGLSYGQWVGVWLNQMMSDDPDISYGGAQGMVFLRGNVQYGYKDDPEHSVYSSITKESRLKIPEGTPVFIPVINTWFYLEDEYAGQIMKNEVIMRNIARRDTVNGGDQGIRIMDSDGKIHALVGDLNDFIIESPLFSLKVSEKNPFKGTLDRPIEAGTYYALSVGVFVIISHIPKGTYRLSVFGRGIGTYLTKTVYDIEVTDGMPPLNDISDSTGKIVTGFTERFGNDPMGFVAPWNSPKATI